MSREIPTGRKINVMLDLETLGTKAGSVITSIGAVKFDANGSGDEFYCRIDIQSALDCGLKVSGDTIYWWLEQSDAARQALLEHPRLRLPDALFKFSNWLFGDDYLIWGNGASFDNTLLEAAYDAINMKVPWKFYNNRCYRTLKSEAPNVSMERCGELHNALDDARSQAEHLIRIWNRN